MKAKFLFTILAAMLIAACEKEDMEMMKEPLNPDSAPEVSVDRFSDDAAHLFVRTIENGFPDPNEAVDFDMIPAFITKGLGPDGKKVEYYNFDVMSTTPAPIFVLYRTGENDPVEGQLNIINVKPGDAGYNDFWQVNKVAVPADYVANTITSSNEILEAGYQVSMTNTIVNCPVVPKGSVARKRFTASESTELTRGWYKNQVVYYFNFFEKILTAENGMVPTSDIFVTFNINPDQPDGGPVSGFRTEDGMETGQTHNVAETVPTDDSYSPLWDVNIYDNKDFGVVEDLSTATTADILAHDAAIVNCPIVSVEQ